VGNAAFVNPFRVEPLRWQLIRVPKLCEEKAMRNPVLLGSVVLLAAATLLIDDARAEMPSNRSTTAPPATAKATANEAASAQRQIDSAAQVVNQMKSDSQLVGLLERAKGVFIVPRYGKAAAIIGGRGGEGVLVVREGEQWSNPAFFTFGGVTVGAQAGVASGSVAMLLMSDKAVQQFKTQQNSFTLDADAGLTLANYSANAQIASGNEDVIFWSATRGLFAGAALGVNDVRSDAEQNRAYYSRPATPQEIFSGVVSTSNADTLRGALPARVATTR
jgi:lipid-binding SYLF domain-containing protein